MKCKCHPDSPFHWRQNPRPSIFFKDVSYRATSDGQTLSHLSSALVDKARSNGQTAGFIKGISKDREAEILRMRNFNTFALAVVSNAKLNPGNDVSAVRSVDECSGVKDTPADGDDLQAA